MDALLLTSPLVAESNASISFSSSSSLCSSPFDSLGQDLVQSLDVHGSS